MANPNPTKKATPKQQKASKSKATPVQSTRRCAAGRPTWLPDLEPCTNNTAKPTSMLCADHEAIFQQRGGRKYLGELRQLVATQRAEKKASIEKAKEVHAVEPKAAKPKAKASREAREEDTTRARRVMDP